MIHSSLMFIVPNIEEYMDEILILLVVHINIDRRMGSHQTRGYLHLEHVQKSFTK